MIEKNVLSNIRETRIKEFIVWLLLSIVPNTMCIGLASQGNFDEMWFVILLAGIFAWICDFGVVKTLIMAIHPEKNSIFKKYGGIEKVQNIVDEINNTIEYEDENLILAKNYIASKRCVEDIVAYDDVLAVHKLVHKTNFVVDWYALVVTNKYNEQTEYKYGAKEQEKVDKLILLIGYRSKNAKVGYTDQAKKHVKENVVPIPQEEQKESKIEINSINQENKENEKILKTEKYACPDCNNIITTEDKFCRNCGCKIDWS